MDAHSSSLLRIFNDKEIEEENSIIMCAERGSEVGVRRLISSVVDINQFRGLDGFTPLHHAANRGHGGVVALLLKSGTNIDSKNDNGETALHLAAYSGHLLVVEQLLDNDANIDEINKYGESPLFYAARRGMPAVVRMLLQRGANPLLRDQLDETAEDHADDGRTRAVFRSTLAVEVAGTGSGTLPYACIKYVFGFLDARDVGRAACVAGKWHRVSESKEVWAALGMRRWERSLQSSLGFGPMAAAMFRPKSLSREKRKESSRSVSKPSTR